MNLEDWEEFWAYLVGDYSIMVEMGTNHLDNVGEFLEWKHQEWIKHHEDWEAVGMVSAGQRVIQSMSERDKMMRTFNSTQSDAEPGITRFPTESYREYVQSLQEKVNNDG